MARDIEASPVRRSGAKVVALDASVLLEAACHEVWVSVVPARDPDITRELVVRAVTRLNTELGQ